MLEGGGWTAALLPDAGGAVARLAYRGRDVLAPLPLGADPNRSFRGAFVMAPWANRLDGGVLPVAGIEHHLPVNRQEDNTAIHGVARDRPWAVRQAAPARAVLVQELDGAELGLPWRYAARLEVALGEAGAAVALSICNRAPLPFPFGLGWHPFFLRPPGTRLRFRADTLFARDARCLPVARAADRRRGRRRGDVRGAGHAFRRLGRSGRHSPSGPAARAERARGLGRQPAGVRAGGRQRALRGAGEPRAGRAEPPRLREARADDGAAAGRRAVGAAGHRRRHRRPAAAA